MIKWIARSGWFLRDEDGPTAVEYAVMLALIIVVCYGTIQSFGSTVNSMFNKTEVTIARGS